MIDVSGRQHIMKSSIEATITKLTWNTPKYNRNIALFDINGNALIISSVDPI